MGCNLLLILEMKEPTTRKDSLTSDSTKVAQSEKAEPELRFVPLAPGSWLHPRPSRRPAHSDLPSFLSVTVPRKPKREL